MLKEKETKTPEELVLELQDQVKNIQADLDVTKDALVKSNDEVKRLKETNQRYYEKLVDTSVKATEKIGSEDDEQFLTVDELTNNFLRKEK